MKHHLRTKSAKAKQLTVWAVAGCYLLAGLLLNLSSTAPVKAAPTLVQSATEASNNNSTGVTVHFNQATADNLLIAICGARGSANISGPSGFTAAANQNDTVSQGIFYAVASGGENSLTCTSSSSVRLGIQVYEYSGMTPVNPLDAAESAAGSGSSVSSGSINTTNADNLLIAGVTTDANTEFSAWSNSFIELNDFVNGGQAAARGTYAAASRTVSATGSYSTTASAGSTGNWVVQIAAFRVMPDPVLEVGVVDNSGTSIANPSMEFNNVDAALECQESTGALGTSEKRVRVSNNTLNGNWTLSIAATDGSAAEWGNGTSAYAYNNSSGTPAGCESGQLSIDAEAGDVTPQNGCSNAGIMKGSIAVFSAGSVDSVTLLSATGSDVLCYFDLTDVLLMQQIPGETPSSTEPYSIDMTLTIVAN